MNVATLKLIWRLLIGAFLVVYGLMWPDLATDARWPMVVAGIVLATGESAFAKSEMKK